MLPVSLFYRAHDAEPTADELDLAALADPARWPEVKSKGENVLFSPALFEGRRHNDNVRAVTALVLDYDTGETQPQDAFDAFDGLERYLHSTFSSTPDCPKFRLILPLAEPADPRNWRAFWLAAVEVAAPGVDGACKDPARMYYAPARPIGVAPTDAVALSADGLRLRVDDLIDPPARPALRIVPPTPSAERRDGPFSGIDKPKRTIRAELPVESVEAACAFMAHARENAAALPEPEWRAQLSIAIRCDGGVELAHELSRPYPGYDPEETGRMIERLSAVGPFRAPLFDGCSACEHFEDCKTSGPLNVAKRQHTPAGAAGERLKADLFDVEKGIEQAKIRHGYAADASVKAQAGVELTELQARRRALKSRLSKLTAREERERARREIEAPQGVHDPTWQQLDLDQNDRPRKTERNLIRIFETDPRYQGLRFNQLSRRPEHASLELREFGDPGTGRDVVVDLADRYGIGSITLDSIVSPLLAAARHDSYHPVSDWLEELEADGADHVPALTEALGAAPDPLHVEYVRRTLIAAVARVFEPGCKADTMLVLQGEQGVGKSSGLQALFEGESPQGWFSSTTIDLTSKDARLAIHRAWITEFAELAALGKRDSESIKAFLTERVDFYREPYGRGVIDRPRACLFVGSTNDESFLRDPTGSRRFWILPIERRVDIDRILELREAVFAQAVEAFAYGEPHWLSPDFEAEQARVNAARWEIPDPIFEALLPWYDALEDGSNVKLRDAAQQAGIIGSALTSTSAKQVASVLRRLGLRKRSTKSGKIWTK